MRGENRLKILEFLENSTRTIGDLFFIFSLPYGTSLKRMEYLLEKRYQEGNQQRISHQTRRRFRELLYHLRKDGLVENVEKGGGKFLRLAPKGKTRLGELRFFRTNALPGPKYEYIEENIFKIVIFDVPEKEKRKRNWLRAVLRNLNFKMLQKSVWLGKSKLPKSFIADLDRLRLSDYVEIFAISKTGSLKQLKF